MSHFRSGLTVYVGLTLLWSVFLLLAAKLDFEHLPDAPILNHVAGDNITVTHTAKDPAKAQNTISIVPADQAAGKGQ